MQNAREAAGFGFLKFWGAFEEVSSNIPCVALDVLPCIHRPPKHTRSQTGYMTIKGGRGRTVWDRNFETSTSYQQDRAFNPSKKPGPHAGVFWVWSLRFEDGRCECCTSTTGVSCPNYIHRAEPVFHHRPARVGADSSSMVNPLDAFRCLCLASTRPRFTRTASVVEACFSWGGELWMVHRCAVACANAGTDDIGWRLVDVLAGIPRANMRRFHRCRAD